MSWQQYIDEQLMYEVSPGHILASAAIVGLDGNVWAQSPSFPLLKDGEIDKIVKGMDDSSHIASTGLFLGGEKYMVIQGEPGQVIRGKKGPGGTCIRKTISALIIGIYAEPTTPGECNILVERLVGPWFSEIPEEQRITAASSQEMKRIQDCCHNRVSLLSNIWLCRVKDPVYLFHDEPLVDDHALRR
ncbi:hypothetical protein R1sor_024844 [Riccia sorocarpa]|uniref:Profilin n=1 Tax=Riccia sorocarpa TaxID=122646 RepID=A0ABD3GRN7_9MARC